jgi:trimethylamine---corrinoid protein Co-methyltransferase
MIKSSYITQKSPVFSVLSQDQAYEIHRATMEVLRRTGFKVHSKKGIKLLKQAGAIVNGDNVKIPEFIVEECIRLAPKGFALYDREGNKAFDLEKGKFTFGNSPGSPNTRDALTHEIRPTVVKDIENGALIADACPNIDWIMPMGSVSDVPPQVGALHEFMAAVTNTQKPICFLTLSHEETEIVLEMAATVAGGMDRLRERPFVVHYPEPITPLIVPSETVDRIMYTANLGLPLIVGAIPQSGSTSPATLAGTLVLDNAESLMGLIIAQLTRAGTPFILGGFPTITDLSNGNMAFGSPEMSLMLSAYQDVNKLYGLPTWGTAGCSDSKTIDAQAGIESTFSIITQALAGVNFIHDVGFLDHAMICSPEMLVMGDEVIGMAKRFLKGIEINSETLATDIIDKVGPGGNFLAEKHTFDHFRKEHWIPGLITRQRYEKWENDGKKTMEERIQEKTRDILENHKVPQLEDSVLSELNRIKKEGEKKLIKHLT